MEVISIAKPRTYGTVVSDTIEKGELYRMMKEGNVQIFPLISIQKYLNDMNAEMERQREEKKEPFRKSVVDELSQLTEVVCEGETYFIKAVKTI